LGRGVRVDVGHAGVVVSFGGDIEGVSVRKPDAEGIGDRVCRFGERRGEASEDAHVGWGVSGGVEGKR
jgi:hypothetical protein